jgi:hypothetical protein
MWFSFRASSLLHQVKRFLGIELLGFVEIEPILSLLVGPRLKILDQRSPATLVVSRPRLQLCSALMPAISISRDRGALLGLRSGLPVGFAGAISRGCSSLSTSYWRADLVFTLRRQLVISSSTLATHGVMGLSIASKSKLSTASMAGYELQPHIGQRGPEPPLTRR